DYRKKEIELMASVFSDPYTLSNQYIEPDCQQYNPADYEEDDGNAITTPIFKHIEFKFFKGIRSGGGKNQLFVLSDAGMGKTSLLSIIWLNSLSRFWPSSHKCILLKLGNTTLNDIRKINVKKNCILLLDALDEDPMAWGDVESRVRQILQASENFFRVIITCRTQFFSGGEDPFNRLGHLEVGGYLCPVIYLSLFNNEKVQEYLNKSFPQKSVNDKLKIVQISKLIKEMGHLKFRPMLLAHAEDLLQSNNESWTEFKVYKALTEAWLHRERRKAVWDKLQKTPGINDLLDISMDVAFAIQKSDGGALSEKNLSGLIKFNPKVNYLQLMDIGGRSFINKNSQGEYRFSHYSIQEFLLAYGIIFKKFNKPNSVKGTDQIVKFIYSFLIDNKKQIMNFPWNVLELTSISFRSFDLSSFDLRGVFLRKADFSDAILDNAKLRRADLRGANLKEASLENVSFDAVIYDENTKWPDDHGWPIKGYYIGPLSNLEGADLSGVDLSEVSFYRAILNGANFSESQLQNSTFQNSSLVNTNFSYSTIDNTEFTSSRITNADFSNCSGEYVSFTDMTIDNVNFVEAILNYANFKRSVLKNIDFNGAELQNATFELATFKTVSFSHADLTGVDTISVDQLEELDMQGAILPEGLMVELEDNSYEGS
ncbi:MAG: pentapeptide repeat-containing protein, partial [Deltaproteobacteria bacterium]|nr:pentapeptide repeat-containing protein [Deltaproteobacteria bacterium]